MRTPGGLLLLAVSCVLLAGCGVRFHDPEPGNEFFTSATLAGELRAGAPIRATVLVAQRYAVEVAIACELRQGKQLVKPIGAEKIPAVPGGTPASTPVAERYTYTFTVDTPGAYKFECYTPADEGNFIIREFTARR